MMKEKISAWYDKNYKKVLIVPALLILLSISYLAFFYYQNNDIIYKDVSLTGGTSITIHSQLSVSEAMSALSSKIKGIDVKSISDNSGIQTGLIINSQESPEIMIPIIEDYLGYKLTDENSSIEFTGSSLGGDFYNQLVKAVIFAFLLMAFVVFFVFGKSKLIKSYSLILTLLSARITFPISRIIGITAFVISAIVFIYALYISKTKTNYFYSSIVFLVFAVFYFIQPYYLIIPLAIFLFSLYSIVSIPSIAVIISAFADIALSLAVVDLFGMKMSSAGIVAFLMLIGYSVDTDILLTTRVLKRKSESVNKAIWGAFKTGSTMTLTSIIAVGVALIVVYNYNTILNQIFTILLIGLSFDLFNTWITNTSLIKLYAERNG